MEAVNILSVVDLTKVFRLRLHGRTDVVAFRDVSFSVRCGELVGVTGPSGAGKSSLLKCLYRTYQSQSGDVWYDSNRYGRVNLAALPERQILNLRSSEVGFVSQFLRVIPRVPAVDVVAERLLPLGWALEDARSEAESMLDQLQLPERLWSSYPSTFSGGEQQRVNFARALITRPRLLILDEPTASLDQANKTIIVNLLEDQLRTYGTAMVAAFHDWQAMGRIAARTVSLDPISVSTAAANSL